MPQLKFLGTYTSIVVPVGTHVRSIITPNDVILLGSEYNSLCIFKHACFLVSSCNRGQASYRRSN